MDEMVSLNFFKFLPLNAENAENCPHGDAPGVVVIAAEEQRGLHWCFVGTTPSTLRERVQSILANPGPLKDALAAGARFATTVVRTEEGRRAAEAYLVEQLSPCHNPSPPPMPEGYRCKAKFYAPEGERPAYTPKS